MKVSGATFVRNAVIYQYPIIESIKSLLPLCDEIIVNIGKSDDNTKEIILSVRSEKIKIIEEEWDIALRKNGLILSQQSNIAIENCTGNWIFYLQADEVIHENDYEKIYNAMKGYKDNLQVDGLVFDYIHFYGSAWTYQDARNWYKQEVRIIRNNGQIRSYGDAQGFRLLDGKKPNAKLTGAKIYHYGWARPFTIMKNKMINFDKLWHDDNYISQKYKDETLVDCFRDLDNLKVFTETHPNVVYENKELLNLGNLLFIITKREKYLKNRTIRECLKGISKRVPIGVYKGFKLIY
ncbi:MAG: glycosyltransferase [bacterium]